MKKIFIIAMTTVAVAGLSGCMGKGVGKGKGPVAVEQPVYAPAQDTFVSKG
jgi:hypothetical protein